MSLIYWTSTVVNSLDETCVVPSPGNGRWHHEVFLESGDDKVLFLGSEVHAVSGDLPGHGPQISDTIERWDQTKPATADRLFDHLPVTGRSNSSDATGGFFWKGCPTPIAGVEDWTHANSVVVGPSGNVFVSMRHLNQVVAIASDFSSVLWKLGGPTTGADVFTFPDSGDRFYHQHSAKELPNGNILLFDNGNSRLPSQGGEYSRALELKLDTGDMTVTKVWEYRNEPDLFAACCSNVSRLGNGNTVIISGADFSQGLCGRAFTLVEADSAGNAVAVMEIQDPGTLVLYRIYPVFSIYGEEGL